jgi:rhombotail lipoprotein
MSAALRSIRQHLRAARLAAAALITVTLTGCTSLGELCLYSCGRESSASTPLVDYLYGEDSVPTADATAELALPIAVGLAFLPAANGAAPSALEREPVVRAIRERFRGVPYVRDIVAVPDYYLSRRRGRGFEELQQVARLQKLDVVALVSYEQVSQTRENRRALAYLTIAGAFFVRGSEQSTHTLLDLAVIEPHSRSLLLRAAGTSSLMNSSVAIENGMRLYRQQSTGFVRATETLNTNFAHELASFEERVRAGQAPVRVTRAKSQSGGGAFDPLQLLLLAVFVVFAARAGLPRNRS